MARTTDETTRNAIRTFQASPDGDGWDAAAREALRTGDYAGARAILDQAAKIHGWRIQEQETALRAEVNEADMYARGIVGVTVRERQSFGACRVLGRFVKETAASFVYEVEGKKKSARKSARSRSAGSARPAPHSMPCRSCEDHPETTQGEGFCMHGRRYGTQCETCLST